MQISNIKYECEIWLTVITIVVTWEISFYFEACSFWFYLFSCSSVDRQRFFLESEWHGCAFSLRSFDLCASFAFTMTLENNIKWSKNAKNSIVFHDQKVTYHRPIDFNDESYVNDVLDSHSVTEEFKPLTYIFLTNDKNTSHDFLTIIS